jgi:hypothetical protein
MIKKVTNSAELKAQVVDQDYAEHKRNPTNLRMSYHLAVSLFHLRDWTFAEHSATANWRYGATLGDYQRALEGHLQRFLNTCAPKADIQFAPSNVRFWG